LRWAEGRRAFTDTMCLFYMCVDRRWVCVQTRSVGRGQPLHQGVSERRTRKTDARYAGADVRWFIVVTCL
jgi:hypothetical protein